jgi:cysteine desulfurase/selenocysteine lyase
VSTINDYIGNVNEFPILAKWDFFQHAGASPLPRITANAMRKFLDEMENQSYLETTWHKDIETLRIAAAAMINAHRDEIAFVKNTGEGLSIAAFGNEWHAGDIIVTTAVEYPTNIYPWMELTQSRGVELVMVSEEIDADGARSVPIEKILDAAANPKCKMVTLSHVEFASGQRHDLARIGKFCRENGKLLCVDAIQSMGVLPIDVKEMCIDYLSAGGHKWLMGPLGSGIFYCRRGLLEKTRPPIIGVSSVSTAEDSLNFQYVLKTDARRFESGALNVPGLLGLKISVELLTNLGTQNIAARLRLLTDRLIAGLIENGYTIASPRGGEQFSGIVSFASPTHNHDEIKKSLQKEKRIEIAVRHGRLRVSPHFYNTEQQIDRLIECLPDHV